MLYSIAVALLAVLLTPAAGTWNRLPTEMGTPPRPRVEMAFTSYDDLLIVHGGRTLGVNPTLMNDIYEYNLTTETWKHLPQPATRPSPRSRHTMVSFDDFEHQKPVAILFGGDTLQGFSDEMWIFDIVHGTWQKPAFAATPWPRVGHAMSAVGSHVYIAGGSGLGGVLTDVWQLDMKDISAGWKSLPMLPSARVDAAMVATSESLFFLGGRVHPAAAPGNNLWILNLTTASSWTEFPNRYGPRRALHNLHMVDEQLILFGGADGTTTGSGDLLTLNLTQGVWVTRTAPKVDSRGNLIDQVAREGARSGLFHNQLVIYGGWSSTEGALNDLWTISVPQLNTWKRVHDSMDTPMPVAGHCTVGFGDTLIIVGGRTSPTSLSWFVHQYNFTTTTWKEITPSKGLSIPALEHHVCVVFGTTLIVHGGTDAIAPNAEIYSVSLIPHLGENREWHREKQIGITPGPRYAHTGVLHENYLYIFGGRGASGIIRNDIWVFDIQTGKWDQINVNVVGSVFSASCLVHKGNTTAWFIESGQDSSESPLGSNYLIDMRTHQLQTISLVGDDGLPPASDWHVSQASAVGLGSTVLLFFGQSHHRITSAVVSLDAFTGKYREITRSGNDTWPVPHSKVGVVAVGNTIIIFGGVAGIGTSPLPYHFSNDMWEFSYTQDSLCPGAGNCLSCPAGTEKRSTSCVMCSMGMYSNNGDECSFCPSGTYSSYTGARGVHGCSSCSFGTYNNQNGASICNSCPEGMYCPVRSESPQKINSYTNTTMSSKQPGPFRGKSLFDAPILYFLVPFGVVGLSILIVAALLMRAHRQRVGRKDEYMSEERLRECVSIYNRHNYEFVGLCDSQLTLALREYGLPKPTDEFARDCLLEYDSSGNFRLERDEWIWLCVDLDHERKTAAEEVIMTGDGEPPSTFQLSDLDLFPTSHRSLVMGEPPKMKTTTAGGVVSVFCCAGLVFVAVSLSLQQSYANFEELRSVLPELIAPGGFSDTPCKQLEFIFGIQGHISKESCANDQRECLGAVHYELAGVRCETVDIQCQFVQHDALGECFLQMTCDSSTFSSLNGAEHKIKLGLNGSVDAEGVSVRVSVDTGIPSEFSNTSSSIASPSKKLLRGSAPSIATIQAYPTVFVEDGTMKDQGLLVRTSQFTHGSTVSDFDYHQHTGIYGQLIFELIRASTIVVERRPIIPVLTFLGSLAGTLSAWMGFCSLLVYGGDLTTSWTLKRKAAKIKNQLKEQEQQECANGTLPSVQSLPFDDPNIPEWNELVRPLVGSSFTLLQARGILSAILFLLGRGAQKVPLACKQIQSIKETTNDNTKGKKTNWPDELVCTFENNIIRFLISTL